MIRSIGKLRLYPVWRPCRHGSLAACVVISKPSASSADKSFSLNMSHSLSIPRHGALVIRLYDCNHASRDMSSGKPQDWVNEWLFGCSIWRCHYNTVTSMYIGFGIWINKQWSQEYMPFSAGSFGRRQHFTLEGRVLRFQLCCCSCVAFIGVEGSDYDQLV